MSPAPGPFALDFGGGEVVVDPLVILLDFLIGDSVELLARKNRMPSEHVEQALRSALSSYGFDARERA